MFVTRSQTRTVEMFPGITRRTLVAGERLMIVEFVMQPGASMPVHFHPHEQVTYVTEGAYEVTIGSQTLVCRNGDSYLVPPNVPHAQRALERTVTIDVFSPPRDEYRDPPLSSP